MSKTIIDPIECDTEVDEELSKLAPDDRLADVDELDEVWVPVNKAQCTKVKHRQPKKPLDVCAADDIDESTESRLQSVPFISLGGNGMGVQTRTRRTKMATHVPAGAELPSIVEAKTLPQYQDRHAIAFLLFREYGLNVPQDCVLPTWDEQRAMWDNCAPGSTEWKLKRKLVVPGSDITKIIGTYSTSSNAIFQEYKGNATRVTEVQQFLFDQGHQGELIAKMVYKHLVLKPGERLVDVTTTPWAERPYIVSTADAVVERSTQAGGVQKLRTVEFKAHVCKDVHFTLPLEHEAQVLLEIEVYGVPEGDYVSFTINPRTMESAIIVTRVQRNRAYIDAIVPLIDEFCMRLWLGAEGFYSSHAIKRDRQSGKLPIETRQILVADNVIFSVPGGVAFAKTALAQISNGDGYRIATSIGYKSSGLPDKITPVIDDNDDSLLL